jgi:hypothetical protein
MSKKIIFYRPSFSRGAYDDYYEVEGPCYVSQDEAINWFDPAMNPEWAEAFTGEYLYSRSPSGYSIVRWTLELPTIGHGCEPLIEDVWSAYENPYTGKKAY